MESEDDANLPPGWRRYLNSRGRIQYESPPPVTQIRTKSELLRHHKNGKYLELEADSVTFLVMKKKSNKNYVIIEDPMETTTTKEAPRLTETLPDTIDQVEDSDMQCHWDHELLDIQPHTSSSSSSCSFPGTFTVAQTPIETNICQTSQSNTGARSKTIDREIIKMNKAVKLLPDQVL